MDSEIASATMSADTAIIDSSVEAKGIEACLIASDTCNVDDEEIIADEDDTGSGSAPVISPDSADDQGAEDADALN